MHPVLFSVRLPLAGLVEVSSYRGAYTAAAVLAVLTTWWLSRRLGVPPRGALATIVAAAVALPVGARLWHIATNFAEYAEQPSRAWTLAPTGHALFGGVALASTVGLAVARARGIDPWRLADATAPGLALGIAVMRVGCFANGCCFGVPSGGWSGVVFPPGSPSHLWQMAYRGLGLFDAPLPAHPTQLYELVGALACGAVALVLVRSRARRGVAFLTFIGLFAVVRWVNWGLRVHPPTLENPSIYGPLYGSVIVLCVILIMLRLRTNTTLEDAPSQPRR